MGSREEKHQKKKEDNERPEDKQAETYNVKIFIPW